MIEEWYPKDSWIRAYTDGSATNVTNDRGADIYIEYPKGDQQYEAIPSGTSYLNIKAKIQA